MSSHSIPYHPIPSHIRSRGSSCLFALKLTVLLKFFYVLSRLLLAPAFFCCLLCHPNPHPQGLIPPEIGFLSTLQQLELQGNALTGAIPKELGELSNLQYLGLHDNQLLGNSPLPALLPCLHA